MDPKRRPAAGKDMRPAVTLVDDKGKSLSWQVPNVRRSTSACKAIVSLEDGAQGGVGDVIARIPQERFQDP